jgi:hypothetical protein
MIITFRGPRAQKRHGTGRPAPARNPRALGDDLEFTAEGADVVGQCGQFGDGPVLDGGDGALDTRKVREWARAEGIDIKERGRVPAEVIEKYKAAAA